MMSVKQELVLLVVTWVHLHVLLRNNARAAQTVPDNVVWTVPAQTLWTGQENARLSCKFVGAPRAVYWLKGMTPSTATTLLTWYREAVTGPNFDDGSMDVGEDYSLIIKRVEEEDEARYICRISNKYGYIKFNHTDVTVIDPLEVAIYTKPRVDAWEGFSVLLPCDFNGAPSTVLWHRVASDPGFKSLETVLRYEDGIYESLVDKRYQWSNEGYGLIVRDAAGVDAANLTCEVRKVDGHHLMNYTILGVNKKPTISIQQCSDACDATNAYQNPCLYSVPLHTDTIQLHCSVHGAQPPPTVGWAMGTDQELLFTNNTHTLSGDTYAHEAMIMVQVNETISEFNVTCSATGEDMYGAASQMVTVRKVSTLEAECLSNGGRTASRRVILAVTLSLLLLLICLATALIVPWMRRRKWRLLGYILSDRDTNEEAPPSCILPDRDTAEVAPSSYILSDRDTNEEAPPSCILPDRDTAEVAPSNWFGWQHTGGLESLRREIKEKGVTMTTRPISIGLFGVMGAGKSAFTNSLKFAMKGTYKSCAEEGENTMGGRTTAYQEFLPLTKAINIVDTRGMKDMDIKRIPDLKSQILGERGIDPDQYVGKGMKIDCPVFVCNCSKVVDREIIFDFVYKFSDAVKQSLGHHIFLVLTHKNDLQGDAVKMMHKMTDIPRKHIWAFENYTELNHKHDKKKSIELLRFILECMSTAAKNITLREQREKEEGAAVVACSGGIDILCRADEENETDHDEKTGLVMKERGDKGSGEGVASGKDGEQEKGRMTEGDDAEMIEEVEECVDDDEFEGEEEHEEEDFF